MKNAAGYHPRPVAPSTTEITVALTVIALLYEMLTGSMAKEDKAATALER